MKARYVKQLVSLIGIIGASIILYVAYISFNQEKSIEVDYMKEQVTVIPVMFLCDESTQNASNVDLVDEFNELYRDKYYLDVEWFTGNVADYRARLKMLNSVDELPAIITDVGFDPAFYNLLIENKQIVDLAPYYLEDANWQDSVSQEVIDSVTEEDGSIYIMPLDATYYSGIFWNKELFKKAGITEFPTTWDGFWEVCDQLKAKGITPLSLHTEGTSWSSMLLATSYLGQFKEGEDFMKEIFPDTYDIDVFYNMMEIYIKAFQYTTDDAIGVNFDIAEKHFYEEETAMLPNGRWMIESLSDNQYIDQDFEDKISFASFPEDVLIGAPAMSGWAISSRYSKEIQEGAIAFLKYRNEQNSIDIAELLDEEVYNSYSQVFKDYLDIVQKQFKLIPNYQLKWNTLIQNDVFNKTLPALLKEEISINEFIQKLDKAVEQYNQESGLSGKVS
ncbi:MAG: extracellular solute-binding protein [Cellulosilyticum sp.]|nr:extracellular solute-binding protein [Cellulosilyticum sp.]